MENADAMAKLYWMFCDRFPKQSEEAEQQRKKLSEAIVETEQRKALLRLVDLDTAHCDNTGYRCFVAGFRLAAEIAATLWKTEEDDEKEEFV